MFHTVRHQSLRYGDIVNLCCRSLDKNSETALSGQYKLVIYNEKKSKRGIVTETTRQSCSIFVVERIYCLTSAPGSRRIVMNKWMTDNKALLIIIPLCFVSRLPQLMSPNLFLDSDECIMGLMTRHFSEGKGIPWFFMGQAYGLSIVEVLFIRLFWAFFGVSDMTMKVSMLLLWTCGIAFFYKTLCLIGYRNNRWAPFLMTILFIFFPAWAFWSMKARGGYLTSFTLSSIVTWMVFNKKINAPSYVPLLTGFLIGVIFQSQPLWLAGLIPVVCFTYYQLKRRRSIFILSAGVVTTMAIFHFLKADLHIIWQPPQFSFSHFNFDSFMTLSRQAYQNFAGCYNYLIICQPTVITKITAIFQTGFFFVALITCSFYLLEGRKIDTLFGIFSLSALCTFGALFFLSVMAPRYVLPLSGYVALILYMLIINLKWTRVVNGILFIAIFMGAVSMWSFRNHKFELATRQELLALIDKLCSRNIFHVFTNCGQLQWQIAFYSNERIKVRSFGENDRYPAYVEAVDKALNSGEVKVALAGFCDPDQASVIPIPTGRKFCGNDIGNKTEKMLPGKDNANTNHEVAKTIFPVGENYFILENPDKAVLKEYGFDLSMVRGQ
jgi:hypothetical protein